MTRFMHKIIEYRVCLAHQVVKYQRNWMWIQTKKKDVRFIMLIFQGALFSSLLKFGCSVMWPYLSYENFEGACIIFQQDYNDELIFKHQNYDVVWFRWLFSKYV